MSTCAWTAITLRLKTGWKMWNANVSLFCRDCHICHTECHICQRHCHTLIFRGTLGAGTILGGAGGSSVINSLQAYPDLIKKYQGLSKKPPELEKFGPIIELINTQNMKPAQVNMLRKSDVLNIFFLRRFLENAPALPFLSTIIMSTELGNVSQSEYFLLFPIIFIKSSYIYSSSIKDTRRQWHPLVTNYLFHTFICVTAVTQDHFYNINAAQDHEIPYHTNAMEYNAMRQFNRAIWWSIRVSSSSYCHPFYR